MKTFRLTFALALIFALVLSALPLQAEAKAPAQSLPTIVGVAVAANASGPFAGQLDTLIAAVSRPDQKAIFDTLNGKGQFTVFAPTDDAFAALNLTPANIGTVPAAALSNILLYHVARGSRDAATVLGSTQLRMLNGVFAAVNAKVSPPTIDGAPIIATNVRASNGIIHVVGAVLQP